MPIAQFEDFNVTLPYDISRFKIYGSQKRKCQKTDGYPLKASDVILVELK